MIRFAMCLTSPSLHGYSFEHFTEKRSDAETRDVPLSAQGSVTEDGSDNPSTVQRRVRVHGTDDNLHLGIDTLGFLRGGSSQGERADTLAVETHILCKALRKGDLVALLDEVSNGKGVASGVTGGKALIGHIEEREETLLLDNRGDFSPLLLCRVDASGVVRAGMKKDNATWFGVLVKDKRVSGNE